MFPEADSVMQEIEQFIQASPVVKPPVPGLVDQDNYDNHDTPTTIARSNNLQVEYTNQCYHSDKNGIKGKDL